MVFEPRPFGNWVGTLGWRAWNHLLSRENEQLSNQTFEVPEGHKDKEETPIGALEHPNSKNVESKF